MTRVGKEEIEACILQLLEKRGASKSICPSDVARELGGDNWRDLMDNVRSVADEMAARRLVRITQRDKEIISSQNAIGPVRIRLRGS